jgi:hypothetical protein
MLQVDVLGPLIIWDNGRQLYKISKKARALRYEG